MVNVVSLVLMKDEKLLLLKRNTNRLPIIVMQENETPEKCIERWSKDNVEVGVSKLIRHERNFKLNNYNVSLVFIDATNSEVKILNEDIIFEDCRFTNNLNKFEEELLLNVVRKCNLINYKSLAVEALSKAYGINTKSYKSNKFMELENGRMNNKKALNLIALSLLVGALFSIFVFNYLGISVPIRIAVICILFINSVGIKNKNFLGFFFVISSIILSTTYAIFTNEFFRVLNISLVPISLFSGFLLLTYDNIPFKLATFITAFLELIIGKSIENTSKLSVEVKERFGNSDKESKNKYSKNILKGILISIPLVIVLLMLLSGADEVFSYYLSNIWDYINIENVFDFIVRVVIAIAVMFLVYGLNYTLSATKIKRINNISLKRNFNATTIITVLVSIILVYLVFTKIQVSYLYLNKELPAGVSFSHYARSGFFQLVFLVAINLIMIISIKLKTIVNSTKTKKILNTVYSIITVLTINMGGAAIYKMNLYIGEFGYTRLRILVQAFTVFLCISLFFLLIFIWTEKTLFKPIAITGMVIYIALNYCNIDNFIAKENIKLINQREEIDLWYISTLSLDAESAINEGRDKGLISPEYYFNWENKKYSTKHWYEYNYFNNKVLK